MAPSITDDQEDKYRSYLHEEAEENTKRKFGVPPNCDAVNKLFEESRTKIWPAGSLEDKVQNLVTTWKIEMFHKTFYQDYRSVNLENYTVSVNGRKPLNIEEISKLGGETITLFCKPLSLRGNNPVEDTQDSSHVAFTTTFPRGFALEVIQVYSGPPLIVYKFKHWGYMEGPFKDHASTGN